MSKKRIKNYDNTLIGEYIRQIENPDSIGYNPIAQTWYAPNKKGYDKRNRGFGVDVENNEKAKVVVAGRADKQLSEWEERDLRNEHINYSEGAIQRHYDEFPATKNMSQRMRMLTTGMVYRGDAKAIWGKPNERVSDIYNAYKNNDVKAFEKATRQYYHNKDLDERMRNHDRFWKEQQEREELQRKRSIKGAVDAVQNQQKAVSNWGKDWKKRLADGGQINTSSWESLPIRERQAYIRTAVRNGYTSLPQIKQAYKMFAEGGNLYGGWSMPSQQMQNQIAEWEGPSMTQSTIDPLSGKRVGRNNSFESEAKGFINALPMGIREQVLANPELADWLYSYSYNVGAGNFKKRVVPALERYYSGNGSVEDIQNSMWATGDSKLRGLAKRRARERQGVGDALWGTEMDRLEAQIDNPALIKTQPAFIPTVVEPLYENPTVVKMTPTQEQLPQPIVEAAQEEVNPYQKMQNVFDLYSALDAADTTPLIQHNANAPYVASVFGEGGGIHIKPSHRGRLTALKARTGKTEAELYNDGNPAHKKMVVFARNARKFKHAGGGELSKDNDDKGFNKRLKRSSDIMSALSNLVSPIDQPDADPVEPWVKSDYDDTAESMAQATYLLNREDQKKAFMNKGYLQGEAQDYGLVKSAAERLNDIRGEVMPVYQTQADDIDRANLIHVGNNLSENGDNLPFENYHRQINNGETIPTAYYIGTDGYPYAKSWNLNDYGLYGGQPDTYEYGLKNIGAKLLDRVGSPVVVTSGYGRMSFPNELQEEAAKKNNLVPIDFDDKATHYGYMTPEVVVTAKKRAKGGPINVFADGGAEDEDKTMLVDMTNVGVGAEKDPRYYVDNSMHPLDEVTVEYNPSLENARKQWMNEVIASNDATIVESVPHKEYNPNLKQAATEGANIYAAWAKEHPYLNSAGIVAGAIPFAVAAAPAVVVGGDALAGSTVGQGLTALATNPYVDVAATSYFGADGIQDIMNGNANWETALEVTPLVGGVVKAADKVYDLGKGVVNAAQEAYNNGTFYDKYTTIGGRFGKLGRHLG